MTFKEKIKIITSTNWIITLRVNFYYFPFCQAIKLPILVSYRSVIKQLRGRVETINAPSTGMMLFGYKVLGMQDHYYDRSVWQISGNLRLSGKNIVIGRGSKLCVSGLCELGDNFSITGNSTIICRYSTIFDKNVLISWDVLIMDTDFHRIYDENNIYINEDKAIIIGEKVWIGCKSTVLKGSIIPSNTIIAACSIICGKLDKEGCIYTSDKRILKDKVKWRL